MTKITQKTEVLTVTCKYNTVIDVKIDYRAGLISILDTRDNSEKVKSFTFANRTLAYMDGWRAILDDIKEAVGIAEKKLQTYQEKKTAEHENLMMALINEDFKNTKKKN